MSTVEVSAPEAAPPSPGRWRALLLAAVAACAACGIIYELALLTLSASLDGGGIVATSLIVAGYIAALGVGALLAKPLLAHAALGFITVEALLGVVGGLSAAALYVVFAFLDGSVGSTWVLAVSTALIGGLVGAEVPLLMTLLQRGRTAGPADAGRTLANLNAADYLGALLGGLVWPFLLLPQLGMIRGAAATGMINLAAAAVVAIFLLRQVVSARQLALALCALAAALALLASLLLRSADVETTSRQRLYADPIIAYRHTPYQEIVVTRRGDDTRLYLDGGLQFSTRDEYRYTESLVYPALGNGARSVLVLGGLLVVQAGSPFSTPTAYWRTVSTIRAAGYAVTPYHVHVPTFGDWGFVLAQRGDTPPAPKVPPDAPPLRFLDQRVLQAAVVFSGDVGPRPLEPSTLDNPRIVGDMRHGYD